MAAKSKIEKKPTGNDKAPAPDKVETKGQGANLLGPRWETSKRTPKLQPEGKDPVEETPTVEPEAEKVVDPVAVVDQPADDNPDLRDIFRSIDDALKDSESWKRRGQHRMKRRKFSVAIRKVWDENFMAILQNIEDRGLIAAHYENNNAYFWIYLNAESIPTPAPITLRISNEVRTPAVIETTAATESAKGEEPSCVAQCPEQDIIDELQRSLVLNNKQHEQEIDRMKKRLMVLETENARLKAEAATDDRKPVVSGEIIVSEVEFSFLHDAQPDELAEKVNGGWEIHTLQVNQNGTAVFVLLMREKSAALVYQEKFDKDQAFRLAQWDKQQAQIAARKLAVAESPAAETK